MNTRKASLRKLRLPGAAASRSRNGLTKTTVISKFFNSQETSEDVPEMTVYTDITPSPIAAVGEGAKESVSLPKENHVDAVSDVETTTYSDQMPSPIQAEDPEGDTPQRALRTRLSTFLPKDKRLKAQKRSAHDFETPKKAVKRAPKKKKESKPCSKKQQKLKSAFFQNEKLFSEVAAQHCLADDVNPEEMQMALALSRSVAETSMSVVEGEQVKDTVPDDKGGIRDKLKQFGFRVTESEEYNLTAFLPNRRKTKWANKFTPLTLRNPQRQLEKVNQRIENLLSFQFAAENSLENDDALAYSLKSKLLMKFNSKGDHVIRFDVSDSATVVDFYVLSLFEPSRTKPGHLLKDVRRIAGRDATPKKATLIPDDNDGNFQSPVLKKSRCDEGLPASCPTSTRNLLEVFDFALTQPSLVGRTRVSSGDESVSSCEVEHEEKGDKMTSDCETTCKTISNEISKNITSSVCSPVRCTSPDIFADSDSEIATDEFPPNITKMNASKSSSSDHHITTYEIFSSDEVKTFSMPRKESDVVLSQTSVIDLTQCGSDSNSQPSQKEVPLTAEDKENSGTQDVFCTASSKLAEMEVNSSLSFKSIGEPFQLNGHLSFEKSISGKAFGKSFGSSVSEDFDKSCALKNRSSEISIDLTQDVEDEEDDCIVLSDDEVNYSIWKANKTDHVDEGYTNENTSSDLSHDKNNDPEGDKHEFSFIELVAGSQPLPQTQSDDFMADITTKTKSSLDLEMQLDGSKRSDFGILEEQSPFKTPTKTPKKITRTTPTSKSPICRKALSDSFTLLRVENKNSSKDGESIPLDPDNVALDAHSPFKTPTKSPTLNATRKTPTSTSPSSHLSRSSTEPENKSKRCSSAGSFNGNSQLDLDYSKRSDFGILDEISPFKTPTKTPKRTPKKSQPSASPKCRKALSESFLLSPGESVNPLKRFSSTSKFKEFAKCDDDDDNLSDLDEIDKLIYGSPSKRAYKKPAGLDQLLTGPINTEIDSPPKTQPDSPKEFIFNGRTYLVRTSNVSQMLDYESMDESALLNQLYKYGIRRLKRKQAIKVLEYIYKQTHPCLVEASETSAQSTQVTSEDDNAFDEDNFANEQPTDEGTGLFKFNLKDCWGHLLVSQTDVQMEIEDEQYIVQTNTTKKVSQALLPFHIAWYNLVKSNKSLHEAILHYEPIDLQEIFVFFKKLGYRYDPKELKYFFDSRSIIFRYDLNKPDPSAGSNRHVRKRPYKSTQRKAGVKKS